MNNKKVFITSRGAQKTIEATHELDEVFQFLCGNHGSSDVYKRQAEYHVDFNRGDNAAAGTAEAPLRTFSAVVKKVQPGDTIRLVPSDRPIHAVLMLNKVKGTADKPITVDGAFNTLTGAARVRANEAAAVSPGLYLSLIHISVQRA